MQRGSRLAGEKGEEVLQALEAFGLHQVRRLVLVRGTEEPHGGEARNRSPILAGSKLPWRPLTPGLHNFQGMSQISGSSGRHPQTSHHHTAA